MRRYLCILLSKKLLYKVTNVAFKSICVGFYCLGLEPTQLKEPNKIDFFVLKNHPHFCFKGIVDPKMKIHELLTL